MKKTIFILFLIYSTLSYASPWECINRLILNCNIYRMEVPHGWIVAIDNPPKYGITFLPDEKHEWIIK